MVWWESEGNGGKRDDDDDDDEGGVCGDEGMFIEDGCVVEDGEDWRGVSFIDGFID